MIIMLDSSSSLAWCGLQDSLEGAHMTNACITPKHATRKIGRWKKIDLPLSSRTHDVESGDSGFPSKLRHYVVPGHGISLGHAFKFGRSL